MTVPWTEGSVEIFDGVAMGSPLGPLLANVFMCSIEGSLKSQGKLPDFYRRYVDDTLVKMPDLAAATVPLRNKRTSHTQSIRAYAYGYTRIRV